MPKFTPLRERVLVATATNNAAEIRRIKREIIDAYRLSGGTVVATAKRLGVNQMTLRRIARELAIEPDLGIDPSRGEAVLLFSRARVAVETGDKKTIDALKRQILTATERAGPSGGRDAAKELGVSVWALKKTIDVLGMSGEVHEKYPGKYSLLGERVLVAQKSNDAAKLRRIKAEIVEAYKKADGNLESAADALGVTEHTLSKIAESIGLSRVLALGEKHDHVIMLSRIRVAFGNNDEKALAAIKREIYAAIKRADGSLKNAAESLGMGSWALRQAIASLDLSQEVHEKFPGKGKDRLLTVRVDGRDVTHSIAEWARINGTKRTTILARLKDGKSHEEAVSSRDLRTK